jgi:hypothetical protein
VLFRSGKSRSFVNDTPVSLGQLQEISSLLVDLHQQFDTLQLGNTDFQRKVLDAKAACIDLMKEYSVIYQQYNAVSKKIDSIKNAILKATQEKEYKLFWAHNKEQEKNNLIQFFEFIDGHFKKYPDSFVYHYGNYEIDALERLTQDYNEKEIELVHYLNKNKFVDLYSIARQAIFATGGYSIKDLEKYYGFKRKSDIQKGQVSEEYYIKWLNTKEQKYLDEIGDYNKEDCLSTSELLKWFLQIRDKNLPWFEPKVKEINLRPREEKMQAYEKKLKEADLESKDLQKIVYDILGFYYRENKPEYRRYFSRKLKDHEAKGVIMFPRDD